jgi:serine/threonine protein phosphatase 1
MPSVAAGQRIYAIGDIHGCVDLLDRMLGMIKAHARQAPPVAEQRLVFLGDYIDRGPDSFQVVERLLAGPIPGFATDLLMGNHERMLLDVLRDSDLLIGWLLNGGGETVRSYAHALGTGRNPRDFVTGALPERHAAFFRGLSRSFVHGDYLFVHAGIRPGRPLEAQSEQDLLWIREPFLAHPGPHEKVVVHGHTPTEAPEIGRWRIGIDTGAVFSGRLTALVLDGEGQELLMTP